MKYCEKCGKEIHDEAVVCPSCGCSTQAKPAPAPAPVANDMAENPKTARFALGFAFLCPIVGLIFGIKGIKQKAQNAVYNRDTPFYSFVFCLGCAVIRRIGMIYGFLFKMRQGIISGCVVLLRLRKQDRALCTECGIRESYS